MYIECSEWQNINEEQFVYTTCSELVIFIYWTGKSMNNILSYCGLVDVRINASDKDLPVSMFIQMFALEWLGLKDNCGCFFNGRVKWQVQCQK